MPGGGGGKPIKPYIIAEIRKIEMTISVLEDQRDFLSIILDQIEDESDTTEPESE